MKMLWNSLVCCTLIFCTKPKIDEFCRKSLKCYLAPFVVFVNLIPCAVLFLQN